LVAFSQRLWLLLLLLLLGCRLQLADAACCLTGQPTYKDAEVRFEGIPTCSDGPCSGNGFNYLKKGAFESPNPKACCDREDTNGFYYNPQKGEGQWPHGKTCSGALVNSIQAQCDSLGNPHCN
jgi:hypothetical protein